MEKSLKVSLAGPPNVGKSTLINAIIRQKIAITTHKPQTTRSTTLGILTYNETQIVFADTPGIFEPRKNHKLEKVIVNNATKAIANTDIILLLVDSYLIEKILNDEIEDKISEKLDPYRQAAEVLFNSKFKKNILLVANKIDTLKSEFKSLTYNEIDIIYNVILNSEYKGDKKIIPVSAIKSQNIQLLIDEIGKYAIEKPWQFDPESCTNTTERDLAEEITREQLYLVMHEEIPYSVKIDTDSWEENEDGSATIHQSIIVLKQSQKSMIIGAGGRMIKRIGERARLAINSAFDRPVHLFLHVKVREDWIDNLRF